ncbi:MAG: aldehyde ferredoxin oxidoreductase [Planctomycetaceae bacterium]
MSRAPFGYHGRYLRVDLSTGEAAARPLPKSVLRRYLGGSGLGTWLLLQETGGYFDPLSAEAPLVFMFSPLVGSPLTTSAKFAVVSKSPLTNRINDSLCSSHFAIAGKKTGYDAILIVGRAEQLTCLQITDIEIKFHNAENLRGKTVSQAHSGIQTMLGSGFQSAIIGPAGENGVLYATISHDGRHAGRGGAGAVMGAKNLKAIAVAGTQAVSFANPKGLAAYAKQLSKKSLGPATAKYRELGTVSNVRAFNRLGTLPTRNFQQSTFEEADAISPESFAPTRQKNQKSCAACNIGCEHLFQLEPTGQTDTNRETESAVRLEYESLYALGSLCGISDPDVVLRAANRCDELGMDSISTGASVAFAMECVQKGLLLEPDLQFGNGDSLIHMIEHIGSRTGLGDLLAQGTRKAAEVIGGNAPDFAPHVKGLEMPGYDPRTLPTMAVGLAVNSRGADHNRSGAYQVDFSEKNSGAAIGPEQISAAIEIEDEAAILDSLILCKFLRGVFENRFAEMAAMLNLVTGWDVTAEELGQIAKRIIHTKKLFNVLHGWTPAEDTLPKRFFRKPGASDSSSHSALNPESFQNLVREYNRQRGWTEDGYLPEEMSVELDITQTVTG